MFKIFPKGIYIITGLNNHSNRSSGHNGGGSYAKQILYKGVGIGFQMNSKLSFDLMYYWTNDKDYAYSILIDSSSGYTTMVNKKMNGILKVGFSLAWDILQKALPNLRVILKENRFWLNALFSSYFDFTDPNSITQKEKMIETLTPAIIQKKAEEAFNMKNYLKVVLYPEKQ